MARYTLTYSGSVEGWPSFYSYHPESMVGMNNYFYTFKNAQIYRHNSTTAYNTYYGVNYPSIMKTVINDSPLENKLFKTLSLESTHPWQAEAISDTPNQKIKLQKRKIWTSIKLKKPESSGSVLVIFSQLEIGYVYYYFLVYM